VYVTATAINNDFDDSNSNHNNHSAENKRVVAKTQFSLVITNDNEPNLNYYAMNNDDTVETSAQIHAHLQGGQPQYSLLDFSIRPREFKVRAIANQEWENEIVCIGISPSINLNKLPTVRINNSPENNGGTVNTPFIRENSIVLRGKTPSAGTSRVSVTVVRSGDLREMTTSFDIIPASFGVPTIPNIMYPDVEYEFNPRVPNELSNIAVYIKDKDVVRYQSLQGNPFRFTPDISDTGKTFSFERYINGQLIGQKYNIKISASPAPEITRISRKSKNEVILEVTSYGLHNRRENNIKELKLTGNAKAIQLYGQTRSNKSKLEYYEQYQIVPADASKPFVFEAVAIDQRGKKSQPKSYSGE
jgi:hypothetical protein